MPISHKFSQHNRDDISRSSKCGCFCCCKIFTREDIKEWIDKGNTAICPFCGVDAVLGNASGAGIPITEDSLIDMYKRWFMV